MTATDPLKIAIKGSTQEHLPVEDILDDVVILKDGSCAMIMQLSSVNFDLLSEREQMALIYAYGGVLNSLNFPIQIVIQSSVKDVSVYSNRLKEAEAVEKNQLLRERISSYRQFIEEIVKKNNVLSKSFYIVVPFSLLELGIQSVGKTLGVKKPSGLPMAKSSILEKAKAKLEPKKEHIVRLFLRLGLEIRQLKTKELIQLFYRLYNEEVSHDQKIQNFSYTSPIVSAKLENKNA